MQQGKKTLFLPNKARKQVEAQYYAELQQKTEQLRTKREEAKAKKAAAEALHAEIAEDLRKLPKGTVMRKWKISYALYDKIQGNMYLGKY